MRYDGNTWTRNPGRNNVSFGGTTMWRVSTVAAAAAAETNTTTTTTTGLTRRWFESEAEYHPVADETLERIQDVIEEALEGARIEFDITLASGVLTLMIPSHGTWVLNKQTPNRQIWVRRNNCSGYSFSFFVRVNFHY